MYCSLKEVCSIFDSKRVPLSGAERAKRRGPYPYYGAAALMDYVDEYLFDGIYLLTGEDGSVADEQGFPITQYVWGKFWVNNHAHILQGKAGFSTEHLALALRRVNIQPYITGAVQAKLPHWNHHLREAPAPPELNHGQCSRTGQRNDGGGAHITPPSSRRRSTSWRISLGMDFMGDP